MTTRCSNSGGYVRNTGAIFWNWRNKAYGPLRYLNVYERWSRITRPRIDVELVLDLRFIMKYFFQQLLWHEFARWVLVRCYDAPIRWTREKKGIKNREQCTTTIPVGDNKATLP